MRSCMQQGCTAQQAACGGSKRPRPGAAPPVSSTFDHSSACRCGWQACTACARASATPASSMPMSAGGRGGQRQGWLAVSGWRRAGRRGAQAGTTEQTQMADARGARGRPTGRHRHGMHTEASRAPVGWKSASGTMNRSLFTSSTGCLGSWGPPCRCCCAAAAAAAISASVRTWPQVSVRPSGSTYSRLQSFANEAGSVGGGSGQAARCSPQAAPSIQ